MYGIAKERPVSFSIRTGISKKDLFVGLLIAIYVSDFMSLSQYVPFVLIPILARYLVKAKMDIFMFSTLAVLLSFGAMYSLMMYFYGYIGIKEAFCFVLFPVFLYIFGQRVAHGDLNFRKTIFYLVVILASYVAFGFASLLNTVKVFGSIDEASAFLQGRYVISIWDNRLISATLLNTTVSLGLALLPILFFKARGYQVSRKFKMFTLISFVLSFYTIMQLGNRTGLAIAVASVLTVWMFSEGFNSRKAIRMFNFFILGMILWFLYNRNLLGLKEKWEGTLLASRFEDEGIFGDSRTTAWKEVFSGLFAHPMGNKETVISLRYAHNLWLDVGYEAGIIPFVLLLIFTVFTLLSLRTFVKSDQPVLFKKLFIAMFTAFFITFMMEPIMGGAFTYFTAFCFIAGMVQRRNADYKYGKINNA
ncbi:O-antigen ligase family protein [Cohnella sp. GCM10012308]|uniref:O-antigen ligase family protein n=1 Tax=Cohnella sp. GCM10012308 TaxID=3317329 RepID=UPI0036177339